MKKLLVTGFGPFPAAADNPTERLIGVLRQRSPRSWPAETTFAVLPTEWDRAGAVLQSLAEEQQTDTRLHLGYSAQATGFQLESTAYNERQRRPDAGGSVPDDGMIMCDAPARLSSPWPLAPLTARLRAAGVPASPSNDPGRYLCNEIYFRSLRINPAALFVHLPALVIDDETVPADYDGVHRMRIEEAVRGIELLIAHLASTPAIPDGTTLT